MSRWPALLMCSLAATALVLTGTFATAQAEEDDDAIVTTRSPVDKRPTLVRNKFFYKKGRVELRMDRTAIIHSAIGKASFDEAHLVANLTSVIDTINRLKPAGVKGPLAKTAYLTTTMGPGVPLDLAETMSLKAE